MADTRASLVGAQQIKREKIEIVDAIVAGDIGKLPDFNVTDALQRITGVQILRDRGEGTGVAIRGLTQMETLLNGREVFTAGAGRNLDFADIPAEMLAGIDVYKTSSAEHIEGGVGGTVDLRTRRPFDFSGRKVAATARLIHGDLVNDSRAQFSTLLSDRWRTTGGGEFGALLSLVRQQRAWREDQKSAGAPIARTDILAGRTIVAPNGMTETVSAGSRERTSANVVLEWMPVETLSLYAEANYAQFLTIQDSYQFSVSASPTFAAGSPVLFPGSNDLQRITWTNASASTVGAARDTLDRTAQVAVGGEWTGSALTLKGDLSYTKSHNNLLYSAIPLGGAAVTLTQDLSGGVPSSSVGGSGLSRLSGFTSAGIWYAYRPFDGDLTAASLDGEYRLDGPFVQALSTGLRLARRHATDAPGQVGFYPATVPAANAAGIVVANPYGNFIAGSPAVARSVAGSCAALAIPCAIPASNDLGTWTIDEETQSGYAMVKFGAANRLDGNAGLRVVNTRVSVSGYQTAAGGGVAPIRLGDNYTDVLPSMNLRYEIASGLYLRGAASKSITRQDFNQLSPSLTLNPVLRIGNAGNPALRPVRADNVDLAVERYFDASTVVHATGFWKRVDGFITTVSNPETYAGVTYQVSRPQNSNTANIKGAELGYQQFYDFLPGWLGGLGLQANYTYVDSGMNNSLLGQNVPLQNLSKHSYNVVGMYEREKLSARLAYNWRDRFLSGVANVVGVGALPVYTAAYGWLDASVTWRYSKELSFALEGTNLLRTVRRSYYGVETRPQSTWANDRQIGITMAAQF
ncbi:MAG TPA: TonB-dependent receptor [Gallionella sp.]|nr:TonB-dependent receptor [Gallionella sp.]